MQEIARFNGIRDAIKLDFVEHEATPKHVMKLSIRLHFSGLSLSNTTTFLESFGVNRARSTVHNWVQKADLEPRGGRDHEKFALDETVVKVNGEQFWLYAAIDPKTISILHARLYPVSNNGFNEDVLRQLRNKHAIDDAEFFVDGGPWLQAGLFELGIHFRHEAFGERNLVERVFQEIKRRTKQFGRI